MNEDSMEEKERKKGGRKERNIEQRTKEKEGRKKKERNEIE